ncbi:MAG: hypothetical protein ABSG31_03180 [Tepidisphaeraceae bacterium]
MWMLFAVSITACVMLLGQRASTAALEFWVSVATLVAAVVISRLLSIASKVNMLSRPSVLIARTILVISWTGTNAFMWLLGKPQYGALYGIGETIVLVAATRYRK